MEIDFRRSLFVNQMSEQQANQWRKTRTMGKPKYVMYFGILLWGITLAALFTGMEWLTQQTFTPSWVYIRLIVFAFIGFFVYNLRWNAREQKFQAHTPKKGASD
jgi:hypothetical protein